jgi:hypothetical protein
MKLKLPSNLKFRIASFFIIGGFVFTIISCDKNLSDDGKKFVGTWNGSYSCVGVASASSITQTVINKGKDDATVTLDFVVGSTTACAADKKLEGAALNDNITFGKQTFADACGAVWTINGTATLSRDTLTLTWTGVGTGTTVGSDPVYGSCTFRGKK